MHVFQKVGVVHVEYGAVGHRARQIGAEAAVHRHLQLQPLDAPRVVKAHGVVVGKGVALAGDQEVVVPVQPQFDGFFELVGRHRRPHRQVARLRFLAAKAAAHAPALDPHRVVVNAQGVRHPVLCLAGVLGAAVDQPLVLLLRQHVGDLPFQVEVLLPAHFQRAAQGVRCAGQGGSRVAALHHHRRQHITLGGQRAGHAQQGGQGGDVAGDLSGRAAGGHHRRGDHQANHLADMLHSADCKNRLVMRQRAQHRITGNVVGQHDTRHTGHGQRCRSADGVQPSMRDVRQDGRGKQRAFDFGDVVHIGGGPQHLGAGAFMRAGHPGGCDGGGGKGLGVGRHGALSKLHDCRLMRCRPWLSSQ